MVFIPFKVFALTPSKSFLRRLALLCGRRGSARRGEITPRWGQVIALSLIVSGWVPLVRFRQVGRFDPPALVLPSLKDFLLKTLSGSVIRHGLSSPFSRFLSDRNVMKALSSSHTAR